MYMCICVYTYIRMYASMYVYRSCYYVAVKDYSDCNSGTGEYCTYNIILYTRYILVACLLLLPPLLHLYVY